MIVSTNTERQLKLKYQHSEDKDPIVVNLIFLDNVHIGMHAKDIRFKFKEVLEVKDNSFFVPYGSFREITYVLNFQII